MAWFDELREATFRGVSLFLVPTRDMSGGRRGPTHEYPQSDEPYAEDTGAKAESFTIEAVIHGDDYFADRDALLKALRQPDPGLFVDPYGVESRVQVRGWTVRESTQQGGTARFSINFDQAGRDRFPSGAIDSAGALQLSATATETAAAARFEGVFSTDSVPEFIREEARRNAQLQIDAARAIGTGVSPLDDASAAFGRALDDAQGLIQSAIPADVLGAAGMVMDAVQNVLPAGEILVNAFLDLRGLGDIDLAEAALAAAPTVTTAIGAANRLVQLELFRDLALARASAGVVDWQFDSFDQAVAARDQVAGAIDGAMRQTGRPAPALAAGGRHESHQSLMSMRGDLVRNVAARSGGLARIVRQELPVGGPSVVIAHRLYGDARRAGDIVRRNAVSHPSFVPGGTPLEVLSA